MPKNQHFRCREKKISFQAIMDKIFGTKKKDQSKLERNKKL